jgi:hypothetical protein
MEKNKKRKFKTKTTKSGYISPQNGSMEKGNTKTKTKNNKK